MDKRERIVAGLLHKLLKLISKYGIKDKRVESFIRSHKDNEEFIGLAATVIFVQGAYVEYFRLEEKINRIGLISVF